MGDLIGQGIYGVMVCALHRASGRLQIDFELKCAPSEDAARRQGLQLALEKYPAAAGHSEHQAFARLIVSVGVLLAQHRRGGAVEVARALLDLTREDDDEGGEGDGGERLKELLM